MKNQKKRRHYGSWAVASVLGALALYPFLAMRIEARKVARRLNALETQQRRSGEDNAPLASAISLRVQKLGPLLASWETIGGCGAGGTGGAGVGVKWVGRNTAGGLFQSITQANYIRLNNAYNYIVTTQVSRDVGRKWNVGVLVPFLYKRYNDYLGLPTDISNSGVGDVNLLVTRKFGRINSTAVTASLGFPTGTHDATYKTDLLTQEKQLGLGKFTGTLTLDHSIDEGWGIVVLGGSAAWRGGRNELGSYRSPTGGLYGYIGYYLGPFVPVLGASFAGFLKPDEDRGAVQNVPLTMVAGNASVEWSSAYVAILAGVSVPYAFTSTPNDQLVAGVKPATGLQPWMVAVGISVSPF
jgi:hypothetical protein